MTAAGGVRIVHADKRLAGKVVVIPTFRRKLPKPCQLCQVWHVVKHYHLRLDGQAAIIVAPKVLAGLRAIGQIRPGRFEVESHVAKPPRQTIAAPGRGRPERRELAVLSHALEGIAPPGARVTVTNGRGDRRG